MSSISMPNALLVSFVILVPIADAQQQVRFAYTANNGDGTVSAFSINSTTGNMNPIGTLSTGGTNPTCAAVHPSGKFLYITNHGSSTLSIFKIDNSSGALTSVSGSPMVSQQPGPQWVTFDAAGNFAYVANEAFGSPANASVSAYQVDTTTGALTPVLGSPFPTGSGPHWVALHPSGQYLYTANAYADSVSIFKVNSTTGVLTQNGSVATGSRPRSVTPDPSGAFVYVANENSGSISGYSVDSGTGSLVPLNGFPVASGSGSVGLIFDHTGRFLYSSNSASDSISGFFFNSSTGALAALTGSPFSVAPAAPYWGAVDPANKFLFMGTISSNTVLALTIDPASGALVPVSGSPFSAGSTPVSVTLASSSAPKYNVCLLYDPAKAVHSGATIPIKLQLCNSGGNDLSSPAIILHASGITQNSTSISGQVQDAGNANPDLDFRYDSTLGPTGGYIFNLKTTGLNTGSYNLSFTATGDSTSYVAPFQVK